MAPKTHPQATYVICPKCRKRVGKDQAKTTPEWTIYPARCPHCHQGLLETLLGLGLTSKAPKPPKDPRPKRTRAEQAAADLDAAAVAGEADDWGQGGHATIGRPPKLTRELMADAEAFIQGGAYAVVVARALGISEGLWYQWLDRGRKALAMPASKHRGIDGLCAEFVTRMDMADAQGELKLLLGPTSGALGWQGMAWTMERKWADRWGRSRAEAPLGGTLDALVDAIGKARAASG